MIRFKQSTKVIITGLLLLWIAIPLIGGSSGDVQYIAIHFGNPEYAKALDRSVYSGFSFYSAPEAVYLYDEAQKFSGNYTNLQGWYGKFPEIMGFGANAAATKKGLPYRYGTILVVDAAGTIYYQVQSHGPVLLGDVKSPVKKVSKGKLAKPLKAKKCKYLKSTPIGELQPSKGSKVDEKQKGMVGWKLPDYPLMDDQGKTVNLQDIVAGKSTVLIFYTMNGGHMKNADKKGNIIKEWDEEPLGSLVSEKNFENAVTGSTPPPNPGSFLLKAALTDIAAGGANTPYLQAVKLMDLANEIKTVLKH